MLESSNDSKKFMVSMVFMVRRYGSINPHNKYYTVLITIYTNFALNAQILICKSVDHGIILSCRVSSPVSLALKREIT